jgi:hypothetical protein
VTKNEPKILTKDDVESAPETTMEDVATEEEKALSEARRAVSDAVKRTEQDPGALLESDVVEAAALIYRYSPAEWIRIRNSLKSQGILRELDKQVRKASLKLLKGGAASAFSRTGIYQIVDGAICLKKEAQNCLITVPLANFNARIISEQLRDDCSGEEPSRILEIEGLLQTGETLPRILIPSDRYSSMSWVVQGWGPRAVIAAGLSTRDHLREAIQLLSGAVPRHTVLTHLGWRKESKGWIFVHARGAIGHVGQEIDQYRAEDVYLPRELQNYYLPELPTRSVLQKEVRASLGLFELAPDVVTIPLFIAAYRAPLGMVDFSLHISGPTGAGKSELAALSQQHCGAAMDARHLPASWSSTSNALEALLYAAKDSVIVIDDFCPTGSTSDIQRFHRDADRVLRAQGNNSGRTRMMADASLRKTKYPRGLVISTGEEVFRGQSLRARVLNLELGPGQLDFALLSTVQKEAAEGLYAQAYAGYLSWLSKRIDKIHKTLRQETAELRVNAAKNGQHRRIPDIVASLALGLRIFLQFAFDIRAICESDMNRLWKRGWEALLVAGDVQQQYQLSSEPTQRFLELLRSGIASGSAHIASPNGDQPDNAQSYGWRRNTVGTGDHEREEWRPQGKRIGWVDGNNLYLEPDSSYTLAQELTKHTGEGLTIGKTILHKRLRDRKLLRTFEGKRGLTARVTLEGVRQPVLHFHTSDLLEPAQSAQSAQSPQSAEAKDDVDADTEEGTL